MNVSRAKASLALGLMVCLGVGSVASADITGVSGPMSTRGVAAMEIAAPAFATNAAATNEAQQGFNEQQDILLTTDVAVDGGMISSGTWVSSHMIFLNNPGGGRITHNDVVWTFDGDVLGVMSNSNGGLEMASTSILGSTTTTYPGSTFNARGFEGNDDYTISGNTLTVDMTVTQPGDWIRVVTASPVPAPGAALLAAFGLPIAGLAKRRKR